MSSKSEVYPSELLLPFMKARADLGDVYKKPSEYNAAYDTATKFIDIVRGMIDKARPSEEENHDRRL